LLDSLLQEMVLHRCFLSSTLRSYNRPFYFFINHLRSCSSSSKILQEHSLKVPSFGGSLWVKSSHNVQVCPTNTMDYPNLDQAFVKVVSKSTDNTNVEVVQEGHKLTITENENTVNSDESAGDVSIHVEVPIVYDVNVETRGEGNIHCKDMIESHYCHLTSEMGDITVSSVKTQNLILQSESGDVRCKGALQGSVSIVTGDGDVVSDKRFLGPNLDISTDTGDIEISSCYSDQSKFSTQTGNLSLRNIHNESYVAVYNEGNVSMQGVDGTTNVFVKKGELDMQISHVGNESRVHIEEGNVNLKMADNHPVKLCVTGKKIFTDETFSKYGDVVTKEDEYQHYFGTVQPDKFSPLCQVMADQGEVKISSQHWAQSLGLKLKK